MNRNERIELTKAQKIKQKADNTNSLQRRLVWEFENYIKERLRAMGIIE